MSNVDTKMEMWRQTNAELAALYEDEVRFGAWRYLWERFGPNEYNPQRQFAPRTAARWYVADLYATA